MSKDNHYILKIHTKSESIFFGLVDIDSYSEAQTISLITDMTKTIAKHMANQVGQYQTIEFHLTKESRSVAYNMITRNPSKHSKKPDNELS